MVDLTGKDAADRAIKACTGLAATEMSEAASLIADCVPDAKRMMSQAQRKLDSLGSLAVLANLIKEVDWD